MTEPPLKNNRPPTVCRKSVKQKLIIRKANINSHKMSIKADT